MNYPTDLQQKMAASSYAADKISGTGPVPSQYDSVQSSRPSTEIEGCLSRANNAAERLHNRISVIEDRIRPVMRGLCSGQSEKCNKPEAVMSPLGDAISGIENRIDSACDRLEALLAGLAL